MNIALLVIDVQKAFLDRRKNEESYRNTLKHINTTSALFRQHHKPVFVIRDIEEGDSEEYQNIDDLCVEQVDIPLTKTFNNCFWKTDLEHQLVEMDIDTVVICGNALEYCITATYFGAKERGFNVFMLQNGIFAENDENLQRLYFERPLIAYQAIQMMLVG